MRPSVEPFPLWAWFVFAAALLACVALDLIHRALHRRQNPVTVSP